MLCLLLLSACSCSRSLRPAAVLGPSGTVILDSRGVYVREGYESRKLAVDGITRLHLLGGEVWGTCDRGCGSCRLLPVAGRAITKADGLLDDRVVGMTGSQPGQYFFSYDPKLDLGVSVLTATSWSHFSSRNSPLASGRVAELVPDASGGVWVKYGVARLGVARIADGKAVNYTTANSALPYDTVELVVPEPLNGGLTGSLVWLVTVDGLTRFDPGKDEWKHFGRKHGDATDFLRMSGLDALFGKEITGINGIAFTRGNVWISTRSRLFRFDGNTFYPVPANILEDIEKLRYSSIVSSGAGVWVTLENIDSRKQVAIASWNQGKGWMVYRVSGFGLRAPENITSCRVGDGLYFLATEWAGRFLRVSSIEGLEVAPDAVSANPGK